VTHFKVSLPHTDAIQGALADCPVTGVEESPTQLVAWFASEAVAVEIAKRFASVVERVEDADWSERWKAGIRAVRVGPFEVVPPWLDAEPRTTPFRIVIDPGMAFGTGDHPTTRACLALLARNVKPGDRVLDFGCGSGILGIAAVMLGAKSVYAIDCEEAALTETRKNMAANAAGDGGAGLDKLDGQACQERRCSFDVRLGTEPPLGPFDVIVSNIQSTVLGPRLPRLADALAPGGTMILAGILADEGFSPPSISARLVEHPWVAFECVPRATESATR
jgi:ribosomal protein L11 methyltransferase